MGEGGGVRRCKARKQNEKSLCKSQLKVAIQGDGRGGGRAEDNKGKRDSDLRIRNREIIGWVSYDMCRQLQV